VTLGTWLRAVVIGLPLAGALAIWLWVDRCRPAQRWVVAAIFGVAGLVALSLFLLNRQYACMLTSGRANCLLDGAGTLGIFLLDVFLAIRCLVPAGEGKRRNVILMLLLSGALAGLGLAQNLLVLIVFLNLFLYVGYRWLTGKGFQPRLFILRDDYRNGDDR
jgi:NADH:ubiquinone oxidoreductase subunit 4 (subunit M)